MKPPCPPRGDTTGALGAKALVGTNLVGAWGQAYVVPMRSGVFALLRVLGVLSLLVGTGRVCGATQAAGVKRVKCPCGPASVGGEVLTVPLDGSSAGFRCYLKSRI